VRKERTIGLFGCVAGLERGAECWCYYIVGHLSLLSLEFGLGSIEPLARRLRNV